MAHPMIKADYTLPQAPVNFSVICAFFREGKWEMDFINEETQVFASEEAEVALEWPWVAGFSPSCADWESIGIAAIT